ncbi:hypothetical protein MK489_02975 [Myxococcota bacterium]|nr:hypothetical protein [Myxococcota bacterium]
MTAFEIFDRLEQTAIGEAIRNSSWLFPVVEALHLVGLALLGGAVLLVDLRLLGFGLTTRSPAYLVGQARPWLWSALALMFATGIPLFLSEALKCYGSPPFALKMGALALALVYTFGVRNRLVGRLSPAAHWRARALGGISLLLWFTVAASGRWVGFY